MKYFLVQRGFALRWFCIFWICMILEYLHTDKPAFDMGRLWVHCSAWQPDSQLCNVWFTIPLIWIWGMPWPQTEATHCHAQFGLPDKGRAIKRLVVYCVVWLRYMIYGIGLLTSTRCVVCSLLVSMAFRAQVLLNRIDTYSENNFCCFIVGFVGYIRICLILNTNW